jgi:hypothetical protein
VTDRRRSARRPSGGSAARRRLFEIRFTTETIQFLSYQPPLWTPPVARRATRTGRIALSSRSELLTRSFAVPSLGSDESRFGKFSKRDRLIAKDLAFLVLSIGLSCFLGAIGCTFRHVIHVHDLQSSCAHCIDQRLQFLQPTDFGGQLIDLQHRG